MTLPLIITICVLILIAYGFDITSKHTKVPTIFFLLILGWGLKNLAVALELDLLNTNLLLPIFGTIGLILIVLEGGLELEVNQQKKPIIKRAIWSALIPLISLCAIIGLGLHFYFGTDLMDSFINAVPLCVISSAIAIPSVKHLNKAEKEMVIYESSLSDIIGVVLFNFLVSNEVIKLTSFLHFGFQVLIMLGISLASSIGLAFLIKKIDHQVKLVPIMVMMVLIYALAKTYHLPALLFILIFGLFLNNLDEFKKYKFIRYLEPEKLNLEVHRFTGLVAEAAFLIRTIFFILFGYTITLDNLANTTTLVYAFTIVGLIILVRFFQLKFLKAKIMPLVSIAPRGLITIMLFLSVPNTDKISFVNEPLILQIIILSILAMMLGLMFKGGVRKETI